MPKHELHHCNGSLRESMEELDWIINQLIMDLDYIYMQANCYPYLAYCNFMRVMNEFSCRISQNWQRALDSAGGMQAMMMSNQMPMEFPQMGPMPQPPAVAPPVAPPPVIPPTPPPVQPPLDPAKITAIRLILLQARREVRRLFTMLYELAFRLRPFMTPDAHTATMFFIAHIIFAHINEIKVRAGAAIFNVLIS